MELYLFDLVRGVLEISHCPTKQRFTSDPGHRAKSSNALGATRMPRISRINWQRHSGNCWASHNWCNVCLSVWVRMARKPLLLTSRLTKRVESSFSRFHLRLRRDLRPGFNSLLSLRRGLNFAWWEGPCNSHLPVQQRKWRGADSKLEDAAEPRDWSMPFPNWSTSCKAWRASAPLLSFPVSLLLRPSLFLQPLARRTKGKILCDTAWITLIGVKSLK